MEERLSSEVEVRRAVVKAILDEFPETRSWVLDYLTNGNGRAHSDGT